MNDRSRPTNASTRDMFKDYIIIKSFLRCDGETRRTLTWTIVKLLK